MKRRLTILLGTLAATVALSGAAAATAVAAPVGPRAESVACTGSACLLGIDTDACMRAIPGWVGVGLPPQCLPAFLR